MEKVEQLLLLLLMLLARSKMSSLQYPLKLKMSLDLPEFNLNFYLESCYFFINWLTVICVRAIVEHSLFVDIRESLCFLLLLLLAACIFESNEYICSWKHSLWPRKCIKNFYCLHTRCVAICHISSCCTEQNSFEFKTRSLEIFELSLLLFLLRLLLLLSLLPFFPLSFWIAKF